MYSYVCGDFILILELPVLFFCKQKQEFL